MRDTYHYLVFANDSIYNAFFYKNKISIIELDNNIKNKNNNDVFLSVFITEKVGFGHAKFYCKKGCVIAEFILPNGKSVIYSKDDPILLSNFYKNNNVFKLKKDIYYVK